MKSSFNYIILNLFLFLLAACKINQNYLPSNEDSKIYYEVFFKDKEKKIKNYRQSFYFLPKVKNSIPVLKNDGEVIFYSIENRGIVKQKFEQFLNSTNGQNPTSSESELLLAFPIKEETEWEINDKTTLQMKLGYDRIYNTDLPFKLKNKIVNVNDTITINGKKIENCIKVEGYGKTSYNPGPPLGNINIEVFSTTWFAKGLGLLKYKREEKSDSETMGRIIYEKTMLIDD